MTGAVLWQTTPPHGGGSSGPATTANGIMFGCSLDSSGYMYALNAATGAVLWEFPSGAARIARWAREMATVSDRHLVRP